MKWRMSIKKPTRHFTLSAIMFAWIVSFPVILLGKRGILGGIVSLSVFTIPFLYILSILVKNTAVFRIGTPMSVFTLIYMWVVYVLYTRFRQRKLLATGVALFLAILFMLLVNVTLSKMIAEPMIDIWDILFIFILLVATFAFMFGDYAHNKGSIKY